MKFPLREELFKRRAYLMDEIVKPVVAARALLDNVVAARG